MKIDIWIPLNLSTGCTVELNNFEELLDSQLRSFELLNTRYRPNNRYKHYPLTNLTKLKIKRKGKKILIIHNDRVYATLKFKSRTSAKIAEDSLSSKHTLSSLIAKLTLEYEIILEQKLDIVKKWRDINK